LREFSLLYIGTNYLKTYYTGFVFTLFCLLFYFINYLTLLVRLLFLTLFFYCLSTCITLFYKNYFYFIYGNIIIIFHFY